MVNDIKIRLGKIKWVGQQKSEKSFYYPDLWLFFIAIPFISGFNYILTYSNIQFNFFLLLTFTIDTVQGYLAWYAVRSIIIYLDGRIPYLPDLWKRLIIQIPLTSFTGLAIIALTTEMVSW